MGFSRAPLTLDILVLFLATLLPLLLLSWWVVAKKRALRLHKVLQITQAMMLVLAVSALEWEIRRHDWRVLAELSPYYEDWVQPALVLHLACAFPCVVLWIVTMTGALRHFPRPIRSSPYAASHRRLGRMTVYFTIATALTAWLFYWLAFVS